jgi:acetyl-CoA carboxylase biotin carboxyl carrier protein
MTKKEDIIYMAFINIDKKELKDLVKILEESSLSEIKLAEDGKEVVLSKPTYSAAMPVATPAPMASLAPVAQTQEEAKPAIDMANALKSPMVGNAYLRPSPDAENFVKVGDSVKVGDIILIIEAMKVMNPIKAEKAGIVKQILISDSQPVEYDEILAIIE